MLLSDTRQKRRKMFMCYTERRCMLWHIIEYIPSIVGLGRLKHGYLEHAYKRFMKC